MIRVLRFSSILIADRWSCTIRMATSSSFIECVGACERRGHFFTLFFKLTKRQLERLVEGYGYRLSQLLSIRRIPQEILLVVSGTSWENRSTAIGVRHRNRLGHCVPYGGTNGYDVYGQDTEADVVILTMVALFLSGIFFNCQQYLRWSLCVLLHPG